MSKGGGGGGSTTTVQKADPWPGVQDALRQLYGGAQANYNAGGPQYYPGATNAPSNWNMDNALQRGYDQASWNVGTTNQSIGQLGQTAAGGGPVNPTNASTDWFTQGHGIDQNSANPYLNAEASGANVGANPYLTSMYNRATDPLVSQFKNAIAPGLASQFSLAGRTGSGASAAAFGNATDSLGRSLSDTATSLYGGAYEADRARQMAATNTLSSNYNTERSQQLQANALGSSNFGSDQARRQAAQLALPQLAQSQYGNYDKMLGIGQFQQGQQQDIINADRSRWDYNQQLPTNRLQTLNQLINGGTAFGTQTSSGSSKQPSNPFAGALGGYALGSSLEGMLPFAGGAGSILGAGIGGLPLGLLGGLGGLLFG